MTTLDLTEEFRRRLDRKMAARERALPASRRSIRASANAIRAIHRGDLDEAHRLMEVSRTALMEGRDVLAAEPDVYHAGFTSGSAARTSRPSIRSEEHTSELQSRQQPVCRLL